jgi:hypothetical protein
MPPTPTPNLGLQKQGTGYHALKKLFNDALDTIDTAIGPGGGVTQQDIDDAIAALIDSSPSALNTLNELAAALGDDANFAATVTTALASKVAKSLYDANTILKADADDTPAALTMGASTILARLAAGSIKAATPAEIKTLLAIAEADVSGLTADLAAKALASDLTAETAARVTGDTTRVPNNQTTDYTLVLTDAGKVVEVNAATGKTVTIPTNASVAFPVNSIIFVQQLGAGAVTVAGAGGVTVTGATLATNGVGGGLLLRKTATNTWVVQPSASGTSVALGIACSDETTALTTGTAKATFRMPFAMTVTDVRATVTTAPTGASLLTVDVNDSGTTILSTKLTFDASEKTTTTAATPRVISDTALADDAEITVDIDQVGSTVAGAGLKVWLVGTRT